MFQHHKIELNWLKHAGFKIKTEEGTIYIDPFQISNDQEKANILFISHDHPDHLDEASIKMLVDSETTIFCSHDCKSKIEQFVKVAGIIALLPGDEHIFGHLKIKATPAYNINKSFHPKENQWIGFLIEIDNTCIYFSGDTDHLPELEKIQCDIGLFPVSGIYVMNAKEAAGLASIIKPKVISIPMHWGTLVDDQNRRVGTLQDAETFCKLCNGPSQILDSIA